MESIDIDIVNQMRNDPYFQSKHPKVIGFWETLKIEWNNRYIYYAIPGTNEFYYQT